MKKIIIFAGPNGSGKSSIIAEQMKDPSFPKRYVCPDKVVSKFSYGSIKERYIKAMYLCERLRIIYLKKGISFSMETVFSNENKLEFLSLAKSKGFYIETVYITTKDPNINIKRVKQRFNSGGHDVPNEKIISRYHKSMALLPQIIIKSNSIKVIDNSSSSPFCIFSKNEEDKKVYLLNANKISRKFTDKYIAKPLIDLGYSKSDFNYLDDNKTIII